MDPGPEGRKPSGHWAYGPPALKRALMLSPASRPQLQASGPSVLLTTHSEPIVYNPRVTSPFVSSSLKSKETSSTITAAPKALITPWIDAAGIGGVAVILLSTVLLLQLPISEKEWARLIAVLTALINWPHFMASYRVLYNTRENVRRYPWASLYIPALLLASAGGAIVMWMNEIPFGYTLLDYLSAIYLAWHYTGQGWGTTATFARLGDVNMTTAERRSLRWVFHAFLVWHLALYHLKTGNIPPFLRWNALISSLPQFSWIAHISLAISAVVFWRISKRMGRVVPVRMILPVLSLYLGYTLFSQQGHIGLVVLQLAHALQYLTFTSRVEINRHRPSHPLPWIAVYYSALCVSAWLVFNGILKFGPSIGALPIVNMVGLTWVNIVTIHHYFVDGCIWKLSNPEVRRDLFLHLPDPKQIGKAARAAKRQAAATA